MPKRDIDGSKNDIRVLCTEPTASADAGIVEGAPIDPPDDFPGWVLVDLWVEHDTIQEKGEKGTIVTRKINPVFYQVWVRAKTPAKKPRAAKKTKPAQAAPAADGEKPKRRGRKPKETKPPEEPKGADRQTVLSGVVDTTGTEATTEN